VQHRPPEVSPYCLPRATLRPRNPIELEFSANRVQPVIVQRPFIGRKSGALDKTVDGAREPRRTEGAGNFRPGGLIDPRFRGGGIEASEEELKAVGRYGGGILEQARVHIGHDCGAVQVANEATARIDGNDDVGAMGNGDRPGEIAFAQIERVPVRSDLDVEIEDQRRRDRQAAERNSARDRAARPQAGMERDGIGPVGGKRYIIEPVRAVQGRHAVHERAVDRRNGTLELKGRCRDSGRKEKVLVRGAAGIIV